jgi:hypothetical protein
MKAIKNELDVDFIGNQKSLTEQEERKINNYFNKKLPILPNLHIRKRSSIKHLKVSFSVK